MDDAVSIRGVGASLPRLEARGKLTGRTDYTDDLVRPGMLHAAILGSAHAHASVRRARHT